MAEKNKLVFSVFNIDDPLSTISPQTTQVLYLRCYLEDLSAKTVIEEPEYFDRDYLAEFSAFYSVSSRGYTNRCRRIHFFSEKITRETLRQAAGGGKPSLKKIQNSYLGFVVLRPIPAAPLGRTVLTWYPDDQDKDIHTPRVKNPSRKYFIHVAGIELFVEGLAWQQQDAGVGACATVSLWSMLHSSAFDDHHAIPTTAEITRDAHSRHSYGARIFPSQGLNFWQICDAIKELKLAPLITEGDVKNGSNILGFSKERFASTCASYIRSGYPILLIGHLVREGNPGHAICVVGYRSCVPSTTNPLYPSLAELGIENVYIHDDNLGPNVRFEIETLSIPAAEDAEEAEEVSKGNEYIMLSPSAPIPRNGQRMVDCPTQDYSSFIPTQLIVAAHSDIRTDPVTLYKAGLNNATYISKIFNLLAQKSSKPSYGLTVSTRFIKLATYLGLELEERLKGNSKCLSKVRLALCEKVDPMSLHIGVVRIGLDDSTPLVDILYDTTDSDIHHPIFCHVAYSNQIPFVISLLESIGQGPFKECVEAF